MEVKTEFRTNEEKAEPELRKVKYRKEQNRQEKNKEQQRKQERMHLVLQWRKQSRDNSAGSRICNQQ